MSAKVDRENITIKIGLPENYYQEAATIYTEAFYNKAKNLFNSDQYPATEATQLLLLLEKDRSLLGVAKT